MPGNMYHYKGQKNVAKHGVALRMSQTPLIHTELGVTQCGSGSFEIFQNMLLIFFSAKRTLSPDPSRVDVAFSIFDSFGTRFSHT